MEAEKNASFSTKTVEGETAKEKAAKFISGVDLSQSVRQKYVKLGYQYLTSHAIYLILLPLLGAVSVHLISTRETKDFVNMFNQIVPKINAVTIVGIFSLLAMLYLIVRPRKIYLVDFACFKPEQKYICSHERHYELNVISGKFSEESLRFQKRVLDRTGFGPKTYVTGSFLNIPQKLSIENARIEAEMVLFGAIDQLLEKTGTKVKDIGILVVNCSLFSPTPSLASMIVNHYKLRGNILSYNLGGMGCSAGIIAIDLAKDLLKVHRNTYALVVTTENMTLNWYLGNNKSMLMSNCLFRLGAAAVLLSNKRSDRRRSKYELLHTVRTHKGADDRSYRCVYQQEDENGAIGVALSKDLMSVAGEALKTNITNLGPLVLPMSEQLLFVAMLIAKKLFKKMKFKAYVPNFKLAFEHFCIHAGGRGILDEMQKNLNLSADHMEPSRMTLYRFGNTSASSLWYELAYCEAKGRMKKGDRTWQIAFGAGFKCNSAVWRSLRTIDPAHDKQNPWMEEIDDFPIHLPHVVATN